jgi:hypothetical protein
MVSLVLLPSLSMEGRKIFNKVWSCQNYVALSPVVLPIPIETNNIVPRNSAINIRHMLRLSVMSATPTISLTPERKLRK